MWLIFVCEHIASICISPCPKVCCNERLLGYILSDVQSVIHPDGILFISSLLYVPMSLCPYTHPVFGTVYPHPCLCRLLVPWENVCFSVLLCLWFLLHYMGINLQQEMRGNGKSACLHQLPTPNIPSFFMMAMSYTQCSLSLSIALSTQKSESNATIISWPNICLQSPRRIFVVGDFLL